MVLPVPPHVYRLVRPCEGGIRHSEATNVSRDSQQWQSLYFFHDRYTFKKSLILIYEDLGAATFKVFPCLACMLPRHCCNRPCTTNQDLFFFCFFFTPLSPLIPERFIEIRKETTIPCLPYSDFCTAWGNILPSFQLHFEEWKVHKIV